MKSYMIYGANGYTAALTAQLAVAAGHKPILAGRSQAAVSKIAEKLGLEYRIFSLDSEPEIDAALAEVPLVLHCAGPFSHTSAAMTAACLRTKTHYLDITGEVAVFEQVAAQSDRAKAAGVLLMPGVGFDVVPSDCLALYLKQKLPTATHLTLGFQALGRVSHGTATTMVENMGTGGMIRKNGVLVPVPAAWKTRTIDFGAGPVPAVTIPWGDISTAFYSTGIPNIEVFSAFPSSMRRFLWASRGLGWLLRSRPVQSWLKSQVRSQPAGPSDEERTRGKSLLWGEVYDDSGQRRQARLAGPEGYTLTAMTSLRIIERVLADPPPAGFHTPAMLFGPDLILEIDGVTRVDV